MSLIVNGQPAADAPTVAALLERHLDRREPTGIAVAVNSSVVPRSSWGSWSLHDGDVVDVVTAVQGG
jgi:sulfur carrier protein